MERFNQACSWLAAQAFVTGTANKIKLQQQFYYDLREKFGLSAQMAAICIRHVGGTYSRDKSVKPVFRKHAAMPYDGRIMSFKGIDRVSLLTLEGRVIVPYVMGKSGVPVFAVDPRNTSRTCPECGHLDKGNRLVRGIFLCRQCGHFDHADVIGATNIACAAQVAVR